jgi:AcrR family transcriptional regulator
MGRMARTLNPVSRAVRRDAILDVAERLIRTSGYERMSVQDVQDELGVSRGAIYHYFDSKVALLEAVIERMTHAIIAVISPIATDPTLPAPAKLQAVFRAGGRWKADRRDLMLGIVRAWYSDDNTIVRDRLWSAVNARLVPLLAAIVRQGRAEGSMTASMPDHAATILVTLLEGSSVDTGRLFLASLDGEVVLEDVIKASGAYNEAIERILGLPAGSFELVDKPTLRTWFA